ncbi:hypothetical protein [Aeriscardovia aeriphila]|uniref:Uncharacterized protein n=1 Tax=Aeriscardovia aeriphila TaxID=218139 RepID=A0A261FAM2_9BIFI|nr:hypothetical protein [Aeriscardovia aeriphila]NYI25706.1 hypothetical protein [Aeriscardovia aeriphila]OZG56144.1 hypothetical protein AEAE_0632 [Aeriscardovia aeriphila]
MSTQDFSNNDETRQPDTSAHDTFPVSATSGAQQPSGSPASPANSQPSANSSATSDSQAWQALLDSTDLSDLAHSRTAQEFEKAASQADQRRHNELVKQLKREAKQEAKQRKIATTKKSRSEHSQQPDRPLTNEELLEERDPDPRTLTTSSNARIQPRVAITSTSLIAVGLVLAFLGPLIPLVGNFAQYLGGLLFAVGVLWLLGEWLGSRRHDEAPYPNTADPYAGGDTESFDSGARL